jgi:hypothetical protein
MKRRILGLALIGGLIMLPGFASFAEDILPKGLTTIPELFSSAPSVESGATISGGIQGNVLREINSVSVTAITDSVEGNSGMVNINQASGNLNNQANLRAVAVSPGPGAAHAGAIRDLAVIDENLFESAGGRKLDVIQDSFRNNAGIIGVNQSAGSLNSERNTLTLIIGGAVSLTEMEMAGVRSNNRIVQRGGTERMDMILDSFGNTRGVVQITQSAGDLNALGNNILFTYKEFNLR